MTNVKQLIENLQRISDTGRPVQTATILTALLQLAQAVQELQIQEGNNGKKLSEKTPEEKSFTSWP